MPDSFSGHGPHKVDARLTDDGMVELQVGILRLQLSKRELRELLGIVDVFRLELYDPPQDPGHWAWCDQYGEEAHGPFESRGAALDNAAMGVPWSKLVEVGRIRYLDASEYVTDDADWVADNVCDAMRDDCAWQGFEVDFVHDLEQASEELQVALTVWAKKHLTCNNAFVMRSDTEKVLVWHDPWAALIETHGPPHLPPCPCYDCGDCEIGDAGLCAWPTGEPWACPGHLSQACPGLRLDLLEGLVRRSSR